jgi:MFS transporter, OPA family, sugar phosphate sensor protein UhpC
LSALLNLFKPAPYVDEIEDAEEVRQKYNYWRIRIIYSTFIGYALYYFTRKSFTFAMPGLIDDLGYDKSQLGLLASILSITYGISKFASGILSDRSNPRYFMAFGLMMTGVFNILFGMSSSLLMFAIFWGLNGWFQGFGWPPCAKFLTHWYSQSERGAWWSSWNVSHNVGAFVIPWVVGASLHYWGWRYAMYVPGVICILGGLFLLNRLRDTPQSLGLPAIEKFRNDYPAHGSHSHDEEQELTAKEIIIDYIIKNKYIWLLAAAYFFVYVVRTAVNDWTALYLLETKDYSRIGANGCVSMFEVGGFFGSLFAGWSSDRLFGARRGPVNVLFTLGMLLSLGIFWMVPKGYHLLDSIAMFFVGFSIFGPQMLIGVTAAELSHKKAAATSTGFVGCFAYMGAAVAGYPFGKLTQELGWEGYFFGMALCALIAAILLLPLWGVCKNSIPAPVGRPPKAEPEPAAT